MEKKSIAIEIGSSLFASLIGVIVCSPLDVLRIRLMVQGQAQQNLKKKKKYINISSSLKMIYKEEGIRGYYKGLSITLMLTPLSNVLFFTTYDQCKSKLKKVESLKNSPNIIYLISTISSGIVNIVFSNPLWMVRTRRQTDIFRIGNNFQFQHKNLFLSLLYIVKTEGFFSLYKGFQTSIIGLTHPIIQFIIYENLKKNLTLNYTKRLEKHHIIISTLISKTAASFFTYFHEIIRNRQFYINSNIDKIKSGFFTVTMMLLKNESFKGLYSGFYANLLKIIPSNLIFFLIYEQTKEFANKYFT